MEKFQDRDEFLKIQKEILWGMYQEYRLEVRHYEIMRATVNNILIVASAGLVSLVTYDKQVNREDLSATILLIGFGIIGIMFNATYTELCYRHGVRAATYRNRLDDLFFRYPESSIFDETTLEGIRQKAFNKLKFRKLATIARKLAISHFLWIPIPLFISIIGLFLTLKALKAL